MNKVKSSVLFIIGVAAIVGLCLLSAFGVEIDGMNKGSAKNITLGLELEGGVSVTYEAVGEFTDEDIENAKKGIVSGIKAIDDEQDTEITYFFGQELTGSKISLEEYIEKIQKICKDDIIKVANSININTIYFLKDNSTAKEDK